MSKQTNLQVKYRWYWEQVVSEEWTAASLGEVVNLKRGYDLPKRLREEGPYPVVSSSGVTGTHSEFKANSPGVVTGRYGTLGQVYFVEKPMWPLNTTLYVDDFKGNIPRYIAYLLESLKLDQLVTSAAVPGINRNHIHPLPVRIPGVAVQLYIASALASLDKLIENNCRRIEILEKLARHMYREWFVRFRFPGHESVGLVSSDLGLIPEGWKVQSCAQVAEFVNGFAFKPAHWQQDGLPIVKIKELKNGVSKDTPRYHGQDIKRKYFVNNGAVLFSWSADLGVYIWSSGPALLNQHLFDVRPREVSLLFLYLALKDRMPDFRRRAQGTTMRHIKRSALDEVQLVVAPRQVREAFESQAGPMLALRMNLEHQVQLLARARALLLPRLVSGELDVTGLDLELEAVGA